MSQSDYFWLAAHPPLDQPAAACPPQLLQGYEHEQQPPHLFPYHQSSQATGAASGGGGDQMSCIDFSNPGDIFHFDKSFADSNSQAAVAAGLGGNVAQQQGGLDSWILINLISLHKSFPHHSLSTLHRCRMSTTILRHGTRPSKSRITNRRLSSHKSQDKATES